MIIIIIMLRQNRETLGAAEALERHLKERGLKMTGPRQTVLEVFLGIEEHVTAEELCAAVHRADPSIGQATVFRTVKLLEEAGLARAACRDEGPRRFEHAYLHEHHDHLVCVECGAIVEFSEETIERSQEAVFRKYGFEPRGHSLELRGLCPDCRRRSAKPGEGGRLGQE